MELLNIFLVCAILFSAVLLCRSLIVTKELNYANPFFYLLSFVIIYFGLPALFAEEIKLYYAWEFSGDDIVLSNIFVLFLILVSACLLYAFRHITLKKDARAKTSIIIKSVWLAIFIYLLAIAFLRFQSGQLYFNTDYTGVKDYYKLKNIAYLLIVISVLYYSEKRSILVFAPNFILAVLDMLEGSRTTAFIALVPVFISLAVYNKKTYLGWIGTILILMIVVGILRSEFSTKQYDVPLHISIMGEFRETYILLPNIVSNEYFVGKGGGGNIISSISMPFLPPLREELLKNFEYSGAYAAKLIGRGYGLGNNLIVEAIYYGYYFVFISIFLLALFLYGIYFVIKRVSLVESVILASYSVIFIRLIVREGFLNNFTLMAFIFLFYALPFLVLNKYFKIVWIKTTSQDV